MNKSAIKAFAIWARNKLMNDVESNAYLIGITREGIQKPLSQSTNDVEYFDVGSSTPYSIDKGGIKKRNRLVNSLNDEAGNVGYETAFQNLIEHTASTWFNRLCAIRFMEVNDYFSDGLRVLSSVEEGRKDSDLMVSPFDSELVFSEQEKDQIKKWKIENDEEKLFSYLLEKKCTELSEILPGLFAKEEEPISLLVHFSISDADGTVHHLVNDIEEDDWKEQVQIIGWLYQFYNTEFKDETNALLKKKGQVLTKDRIPAVTQLFTPEWIVKYMVENSLGRIWIDGHPNDDLKSSWKYYLDEVDQEPEVETELKKIREEYVELSPEELSFADVCMGSGHILCYAFDVLMQIYESLGYTARDAVKSILENNLYGVDIDERAYQLAYFSIMMKARQYDRGAFRRGYVPKVYAFEESNGITEKQLKIFGHDLNDIDRNLASEQMKELLETFRDAKEYGSILKVSQMDWELLRRFISSFDVYGKLDLIKMDSSVLVKKLEQMINIGEVLSKKYWVTCTNPPYMSPTPRQNDIVGKKYKDGKVDLYAVFIMRLSEMTHGNGLLTMITMHSWMFLSSFEKLRRRILSNNTIINMVHLGSRAFEEISGEIVQTTSFLLLNKSIEKYNGEYFRLVFEHSQCDKQKNYLEGKSKYYFIQENYKRIPGVALAYWASETAIKAYDNNLMEDIAQPRHGLATSDNDRFLKMWFEVDIKKCSLQVRNDKCKKWYPISKGGTFRKWYGNLEWIINYENEGEEIKAFAIQIYGNSSRTIQNTQYYFKQGLTWSALTSGGFSVRWQEKGALFGSGGYCAFAEKEIELYILAFLNSKATESFIGFVSPTLNYEVGHIKTLPVLIDEIHLKQVELDAYNSIKVSKDDWDSFEMSWDFKYHPLLKMKTMETDRITTIEEQFERWKQECDDRFTQLKGNEEELNCIFIDIYGLQNELTPEVADEDVTVRKADLKRDIKSLISYAVGCMLGRYSLDMEGLAFAGGDWNHAFENNYETFIPDDDNCIPITDENYFSDDIVGRFIEFIRLVYGESTLENNLQFIADAIGGKGDDAREVIRKYFLNDFFKDHCKTYSVTGSGKRPIYWLFDSGKQNGFKALVYMHRWNSDTIATVRARYVSKVQEKYENEMRAIDLQMEHITDLRHKATLQKRKEKILKQVDEIKHYDELIGHLALEHIDIDLDDGVKVNHEKVQHDRDGDKYQILAPIK